LEGKLRQNESRQETTGERFVVGVSIVNFAARGKPTPVGFNERKTKRRDDATQG